MAEIPLAVAPSVRTPGVALSVDLKASAASPGTDPRRALILGVCSSTSTITANTQLVQGVSGEAEVGVYMGNGTPTHLTAKRLFEEYGITSCDLVGAAEPVGNTATGTITLSSSPTGAQVIRSNIAGRQIESAWNAGETAIVGATRHVAAIAAKTGDLPVTVDNGSGTLAVITIPHKGKGLLGNDVTISSVLVTSGAGGGIAVSGANLAGGTTDPDWTAVLALVAGREYAAIIPVASNSDVVASAAGNIVGKLKAHINLYKSGFAAKLQQAIVGCTQSSNASLKTGVAANNFERVQYVLARGARSLPCEIAALEAGARLRDETINPNVNRIGQFYVGTHYGPLDLVNDQPTDAEVEDDLQSGITPISYDDSGAMFVRRSVTSYFKTATSDPDDRVLDVTRVTSTDVIARDLSTFLVTSFPAMNILDDADVGDGAEVPEGCITIGEIRDAIDGRMDLWFRRGVALRSKWETAKSSGAFICRQNPSDGSQVDLVVPASIVRHLAKFSLVVQQRA